MADGTVVAIFGDWGSGKTSYLRLLQNALPRDHDVRWLDLWRYEKHENMDFAIRRDIVRSCDSPSAAIRREFTLASLNALSAVSILLRAIEIKVPGAPVSIKLDEKVEDFDRIQSSNEQLASAHFSEAEQGLKKLQRTLATGKPKVLLFDDLDRVAPEVALNMLETIKLLLGTTKCRFVLALDSRTIREAVYSRYNGHGFRNADELSKSYLDKLIDVSLSVPDLDVGVAAEFIDRLLEGFPEGSEVSRDERRLILIGAPLNPRALKRLLMAWLFERRITARSPIMAALKDFILKHCFGEIWRSVMTEPGLYGKLLSKSMKIPATVEECANMRRSAPEEFEELMMDPGWSPTAREFFERLLRNYPHLLCFIRLSPSCAFEVAGNE